MSAVAKVDDLLVLIQLTELGARVREHALTAWVIDCARRAISTNIEALGVGAATTLRGCLDVAARRARGRAEDDEVAIMLAEAERIGAAALARSRAQRAAGAVAQALLYARQDVGPERPAEAARRAFADPEEEAEAQLRRLLTRTGLLPSGEELLVRLDYAEASGRMPADPDARAWLEARRGALMADDDHCRFSVTVRFFELVFMTELAPLR